jgi:adenylate kinase family enzyme
MRVLVTGASGSGTTTLGRALAVRLHVPFFDADDYYWLPTNPPFKAKRDSVSRLGLFLGDLRETQSAVVAGSVMSWGAELENSFSLVVFLTLNAEIRVARLRVRELAMLGQIDPEFLEWAGQYEEGRLPGRSRRRHEQWLSERSCPVLRLDGDLSVDERLTRVVQALSNCS